jgi:hypothetical protein
VAVMSSTTRMGCGCFDGRCEQRSVDRRGRGAREGGDCARASKRATSHRPLALAGLLPTSNIECSHRPTLPESNGMSRRIADRGFIVETTW